MFGTALKVTSATVVGVDMNKDFHAEDITVDEDGVPIEERLIGKLKQGTVTLFLRSNFSAFWVQGAVFTLANMKDSALNGTYVIRSVGHSENAGEKVRITLNIRAHAGITYTAPT